MQLAYYNLITINPDVLEKMPSLGSQPLIHPWPTIAHVIFQFEISGLPLKRDALPHIDFTFFFKLCEEPIALYYVHVCLGLINVHYSLLV